MSSDREVMLELAGARVGGRLCVPPHPRGLVVFAHGSGSSRHSPRNRYVADVLDRAGYATLLFDLLTPGEALDRARVFDIDLLSGRLLAITNWARHEPGLERLPIGYFGASTGAAAALSAAADADADVAAVVSRGGRPDLAGADLREVRAPTLLIVGGLDSVVLDLNEQAMAQMRAPCRLEIVPGATHLFEEPGTLERAARLAAHWFEEHLAAHRPAAENDKGP